MDRKDLLKTHFVNIFDKWHVDVIYLGYFII